MVVHDRAQIEQWAQSRVDNQQEARKKKTEKCRRGRWSILGIQSLACALLLLLAVLFRLVGGSAYDGLRQGFYRALEKNELMAVMSRLWDKEPFYGVEFTDEESVKQTDFTDSNS
ncbi:MAG: hypothetical protein IIX28_01965 [Clostridia bacterium]|nr:hypothetical protein [Clostridia bacterium]